MRTFFDENEVSEKSENGVGYCDPNVTYYHRLRAFFDGDPDIEVSDIEELEDEDYHFCVTVHNKAKYDLFLELINVPDYCTRLNMDVEYDGKTGHPASDYALLLSTNPNFSRMLKPEPGSGKPLMEFLMMKPEIIQYNNDVFNNPYRLETTTAEALAKFLFHGSHQNFTSDKL